MKPLLLLDIDGPLNPWAANPNRRPEGYGTHRLNPVDQHGVPWTRIHRKPLRVWLKEAHGSQILELADLFELVWASTWGPEANRMIGPAIGLPELAYVDFWAENKNPGEPERVNGVYWKVPLLTAYAAGRPFAWVDDEVEDADREYVAAHHQGPALLHHVSPRLGLLEPDFKALAAWAAEL
ncbi:hypothetical protein SEA_SATIS_76 [Streptomyces phage Satis]|nr:hypothetical protein SEA_SATIS_76 [Streptomyces phage Satis]QBZ71974.1 hypothetical protein SEA_KRADAL_76 [Streptomyces phage Kradal]QPL14393.1 hypothetical protein SEA_EHYELIMAYOE_76 [Streptomyces phage EhyElimayoE]